MLRSCEKDDYRLFSPRAERSAVEFSDACCSVEQRNHKVQHTFMRPGAIYSTHAGLFRDIFLVLEITVEVTKNT